MKRKEKIIEFIWFSALGSVGVGIGYLVLVILTELKLWYLWSSMIGYVLNILISFLIHKFHTFKETKNSDIVMRQLSLYFLVAIVFFGTNTLLLKILVDYNGIHYALSQGILTIVLSVPNYLGTKVVFKNKT